MRTAIAVTATVGAALGAALGLSAASPAGAPPTAIASEPVPREVALAGQLKRERRDWRRSERRLVHRVRAARRDLGDELAEPLGTVPRFPWPRIPKAWPRDQRLAAQLRAERAERGDRFFWLAGNLRANSHLLSLVRHPTPAGNRELASAYFGWEYPCAAEIIDGESGWQHLVWNHQGSGAYGLGQARPRSKMLAYGSDAYVNPLTQLRWFRGYAVARYGSVCDAAAHWTPGGSW